MATYRIRRATLDDRATLIRHRFRMFEDMGVIDAEHPAKAGSRDAFGTWLDAQMPAGTYVAWVVETDMDGGAQAIVAGGGATLIPWPPGPRNQSPRLAFVYNVYTEPEHRGHGLARLVMETLHAFCREQGIGALALNASTFGQPLYEAIGYRTTPSPMMFLSLD